MADEVSTPESASAVLASSFAAASEGSGRLVLLLGEAGIGKTTTSRHAVSAARRAGAIVRWSACWSSGGTVAHAPWLTILSGLGPAGRDALEALVGSDAEDATAAAAARGSAYAAVVAALDEATVTGPALVVIDDLHWADEGTLQLLDFVAGHLPGLPIVVIGTYRPTDVLPGSPLTRLGGGADRVELHGVDEAGVAGLLGAHIGVGRATELAAEVGRLTTGNPFLVVQLGRLLADDPAALAGAALPTGARDLLEQRLAALVPDDRALLVAAAVLGSPVRAVDIATMLARRATDVEAGLCRAAVSRIVERAPGTGAWAFVHDLFARAALAATDSITLVELHRRAAEVLEGAGAEAAVIATHLHAAGSVQQVAAARWSVRAGDRALAALAWEEAAAHYERALSAIGPADDGLRADALEGLGRSLLLCGDDAGATRTFDALAALGRERNSARLGARAALGWSADLSGFEVRLFDQRQIDLLEEAARALDDAAAPMPALRATVLARLSVALSLVAPGARRLALAEQAVAVARVAGEPLVLARALAAHCDAIAGPDRSEDREAEADEIIAIAEAHGDGVLELLGRRLRYVARLEQGDVAGVEEEIAAFARRADTVGNPLYRWYVPLWNAQQAAAAGDGESALAGIAEVEALGRQSGSTNAPVLAIVLRLVTHGIQGHYDTQIEVLSEMGTAVPDLAQYVSSLGALAFAHHRAGRDGAARTYLDRAQALGLDAVPFDAEWLPNATSLLQAAVALGHPLLADVLDRLAPWAHRVSFEGIGAGLYGSTSRFVALGCSALGHHDDAVRHAESALIINRRLGGTLLADALRTLADVTEARDGATASVTSLHVAADDAYAALGLQHLVRSDGTTTAPEPHAQALPPSAPGNELRRAGEMWHVAYGGTEVILRHSKGLSDLAVLLARPDVEVHVGELEGVPRELAVGSGGDALDRRAITSYKQRLTELAEELDEADDAHDLARLELARAEYDALVDQLAGAVGLRGRPRAAGPEPIERLRKAVSARLRDTIRRIDAVHPALGRHLDNAIHTGSYCVYRPDAPTVWHCQS